MTDLAFERGQLLGRRRQLAQALVELLLCQGDALRQLLRLLGLRAEDLNNENGAFHLK